jgi:hypothetical protein
MCQRDESGLQPSDLLWHLTQGYALGWYETGLRPYSNNLVLR